MTINKIKPLQTCLESVTDGTTIMVGGFGVPGTPFALIDRLLETGCRELTIIKNEANEDGMGISKVIEAGRVRKLITSHLGLNATVIGMMNRGELEVEFYPQGILAEKIRAGGAGLYGIVTDIGIDTLLAEKKERINLQGRSLIIEPALRADIALVHAAAADHYGNLIYEKSARNFNPLMATAAGNVIVETEKLLSPGQLVPDQIHTPAAFVDSIVQLESLGSEYGILEQHVL